MIDFLKKSGKLYFNEYCKKYLDNHLYRNDFKEFFFESTVGYNHNVHVRLLPRPNGSDLAFISVQRVWPKGAYITRGSDHYHFYKFKLKFTTLVGSPQFHCLDHTLNSLVLKLR